MTKPRTLLSRARLASVAADDPQRFRTRFEPMVNGNPVVRPPDDLTDHAKDVWIEAAASMGWLICEARFAHEVIATAVGLIRKAVKSGEADSGALIENWSSYVV